MSYVVVSVVLVKFSFLYLSIVGASVVSLPHKYSSSLLADVPFNLLTSVTALMACGLYEVSIWRISTLSSSNLFDGYILTDGYIF